MNNLYDRLVKILFNNQNVMHVGVALFHVLSASHIRAVDAETEYPVLQLNVATYTHSL